MEILVTTRLTLRPPMEVDAEDIALFLNNHNVSRMLARVPFPYDKRDALEFIKVCVTRSDQNGNRPKMIFRERCIGAVGLRHVDDQVELGYWLGEPYWGQGLMQEAVRAVLQEHFCDHDAGDVFAGVFNDNPASLHLQEKMGFEIIGSGEQYSPGRGKLVTSIKTRLTKAGFLAATGSHDCRDAA